MAIYLGNTPIAENVTIQQGGGVTVDDTLSDTSKNPVQNKVINAALNSKANLSDIPTTLPANGGNADTVGNLPASSFLGSNTNFNYHFANGAGSDVISSVKGESHIFAFNFTDTPTAYGFLDVSSFDGEGFSPAEFGSVRQVWTDWTNPSERFVRIYKATSETDGVWTDWSRCNADTLDGKHANDFTLAENKFLDDFFSSKSGDIRALVIDLPSGGFGGNTGRLPNITGFPITGDILITWSKSVYSNGFRYGTLQVRSMTQSNLPVYQCGVYNNGAYTEWQKLCDGGNADTVDGKHADDFALKTDIPTSLPANGGNADTVDGYHAHQLQCESNNGIPYNYSIISKWDAEGDSRFKLMEESGQYQTKVDYANSAGNATNSNFAANLAEAASNICLRNLSSGTAAANTTNCPSGAWYGQHS